MGGGPRPREGEVRRLGVGYGDVLGWSDGSGLEERRIEIGRDKVLHVKPRRADTGFGIVPTRESAGADTRSWSKGRTILCEDSRKEGRGGVPPARVVARGCKWCRSLLGCGKLRSLFLFGIQTWYRGSFSSDEDVVR